MVGYLLAINHVYFTLLRSIKNGNPFQKSNVPVYQVSRLMGHTTINTVQLTYARFIPIDESEKAVGKIGFGGFISLS